LDAEHKTLNFIITYECAHASSPSSLPSNRLFNKFTLIAFDAKRGRKICRKSIKASSDENEEISALF
jgi:hypothetical protein